MKTILIMAGGTGGHIFPGLAVAEQMRAAGWDVVWMGARGGMEERLVPKHGYRAAWIRAKAARGKGIVQKLLLPANLLYSFWESARHIRKLRPNVVLGLGGYVAFPGGMMASLWNRPLALHEQNAIPGLANKVLAQISDKVMAGFPAGAEGRRVDRQPGARGDRGHSFARGPLRRPAGAAEDPGGRRQPRRAGVERSHAESARAAR